MCKIYYSVIFLLLLISCKKTDSNELSLDGVWQFLATNDISAEEIVNADFSTWDTLPVPGNWDTRERYSHYVGKGYYQRDLNIPKSWKAKQIRVKFDAVYETSKVWLNGQFLGQHIGGYTPFEFNITDKVSFDEPNSIVVMADNTYRRGAWWAWGGISRSVALVYNENTRIIYQHISAIPDFDKKTVSFTIKYKLENNSDRDCQVEIPCVIVADNQKKILYKTHKTYLKANDITFSEMTFTEKLSDFELWNIENPYLYQLSSQLVVDNEIKDQIEDNFGIRKLEVKGEQLFFNNEPFYANGFNRVHDHPLYGNTEPNDLIKKDIDDMIALGGRFSRMMHAPLAKNLLDYCDKVGYLVIEEIPVWGKTDPQTYLDNPLTKRWLSEMVDRDFNHPCVVAYSVGNELSDSINDWKTMTMTQNQYEYANSMLDYIDELDTTRLKTYVSYTSFRALSTSSNEPYEKVDFLSVNCYGIPSEQIKSVHSKFPDKPIFISEIGKGQIGPAPDGVFKVELLESLEEVRQFPYVIGSSLWSYNDYRSDYKGTPESGFREWGVVDANRNPKKAYYQLESIWK